jgi:hypothetical protein
MNCQLCQKELDAYHKGTLPEGIRIQVETHLGECKACAESFQLVSLANKVMDAEKEIKSSPFLVTRIMAGIEKLEQNQANYQYTPSFKSILKPALISVSFAAAIFIGILAGNIYLPTQSINKLPVEMTYMNDAALESVDLFSNFSK